MPKRLPELATTAFPLKFGAQGLPSKAIKSKSDSVHLGNTEKENVAFHFWQALNFDHFSLKTKIVYTNIRIEISPKHGSSESDGRAGYQLQEHQRVHGFDSRLDLMFQQVVVVVVSVKVYLFNS